MTAEKGQAITLLRGVGCLDEWRPFRGGDPPPSAVVVNEPARSHETIVRVLRGDFFGGRPGELVHLSPGYVADKKRKAWKRARPMRKFLVFADSMTCPRCEANTPTLLLKTRESSVYECVRCGERRAGSAEPADALMPMRWFNPNRKPRQRFKRKTLLGIGGDRRFLQLSPKTTMMKIDSISGGSGIAQTATHEPPPEFLELMSGLHLLDAYAVGGDHDHTDHDVHRLFGFESLMLRIDGNVFRFFYGNEEDDHQLALWRLDQNALLRDIKDGFMDYHGEICMEIAEPSDTWIVDTLKPLERPMMVEIRGRCTCAVRSPKCVDYLYGVDEASDGSKVVFEVGLAAQGLYRPKPRDDGKPLHSSEWRPSWASRFDPYGFMPLWLSTETRE